MIREPFQGRKVLNLGKTDKNTYVYLGKTDKI